MTLHKFFITCILMLKVFFKEKLSFTPFTYLYFVITLFSMVFIVYSKNFLATCFVYTPYSSLIAHSFLMFLQILKNYGSCTIFTLNQSHRAFLIMFFQVLSFKDFITPKICTVYFHLRTYFHLMLFIRNQWTNSLT